MTDADKERLAKLMEARADELRNEQHRIERERGIFSLVGSDHQAEPGLKEAARIIREQPPDDPWISVEDRLPEHGVHVLVYKPRPIQSWATPYVLAYFVPLRDRMFTDGGVYLDEEERVGWFRGAHKVPAPTHWRPMPDPPNGSA